MARFSDACLNVQYSWHRTTHEADTEVTGSFSRGLKTSSPDIFPYDIVFQVFIIYTGGQSVSHVLLWQPSECVNLIVNIVILFSENKYDDVNESIVISN